MSTGIASGPSSTRAFTRVAFAVHSTRVEEDAHEYCCDAAKTLVVRDGDCGHVDCARRRGARLRDAAPSGNISCADTFSGRSGSARRIRSGYTHHADLWGLQRVADGCGVPRCDGETRVRLSVHEQRWVE